MIFSPGLRTGDAIGIVAPGKKLPEIQLVSATTLLTSWGLNVRIAPNVFSDSHSYLAGTDEQRLADFQSMIDDPDVKAIFCARGGYGSTRIVDSINLGPLKSNPKWIVGFSDITALHLHLLKAGIASIHGTMPVFFGREDAQKSVESLRRLLFDGDCQISFGPGKASRPGSATAEVVGGNLSLITDALGTSSDPDTDSKILVVEEVDEYFYKVDRMFTQLRRAGKLKNLAGLLIGHMTDLKDPELAFGDTLEEIVCHAVRDYDYPVAFSFPSGHENPNHAWVEGGTATLDVGENKASLAYPTITSF